ncbi:hypothetical protein F2Q69_00021260 [Brassica cretica]|uniref:Uncharacterized protein n=1 Tax=Brassica cretica TaxID=69181 RepID=A0A8S9Q2G5_BRACR|nr:hypothetical protein F2Q69_00021260 [Brassica cretica]
MYVVLGSKIVCGCSDRGGARSGHIEGVSGAAVSRVKRWSLVGSAFRVLLSKFSSSRFTLVSSAPSEEVVACDCLLDTLAMDLEASLNLPTTVSDLQRRGLCGDVRICLGVGDALCLLPLKSSSGGTPKLVWRCVHRTFSRDVCTVLSGDRKESSMVRSEKGKGASSLFKQCCDIDAKSPD